MLKLVLILFLFFQDSAVAVTSPQTGETLRGLVEIMGRMDSPNFSSAELAFAYAAGASDSADTWFVIQSFSQPVTDAAIAKWDTASLTDGDYDLRLRVFLQDGTYQDAIITDLKLRNQTPDIATPTQTQADFNFPSFNSTSAPPSSNASVSTPVIALSTSTPLPANPASLTNSNVLSVFWQSALIVLVLFAFFSLILRIRKNS